MSEEPECIEENKTELRARKVLLATDSELRLLCGELTAREIKTIRAVVKFICHAQ